jgi:hypothetical protein
LIGELGFGLASMPEEKSKKKLKKLIKELKMGVPHPNNTMKNVKNG